MCTNQSPLQASAGKATKCKSGNIHKICSGLDLLGCDCGWKPAKEVTALLDTLDSTSTSGMAERGDIMAILDQIQWQCTKCHIILGGTYYRCTVPDCTGTKFGALKELLTLLGRLFVEGEEEKSDSFSIITLADYVNIMLDAHGLARSGLVASSWQLDKAVHTCCCTDPYALSGSDSVTLDDTHDHTGVLSTTTYSTTEHENPLLNNEDLLMDTSEGINEGNEGRMDVYQPATVELHNQAQGGTQSPPEPGTEDHLKTSTFVGENREAETLDGSNSRLNISTKMPAKANYEATRTLLEFVSEDDMVLLKGLSKRQARESLAILGLLHSRTHEVPLTLWIIREFREMSGINSDLLNRRLRYLRESATSFIFDNPNTTMWEEFDIVARENAAMQQVLIGPVEEERFDLNLSRTDLTKLIESIMHREASLLSEPASKKRKSQLDHIGDFMQLHKAQRRNPPCDNPNMTVQSTRTSSQSTPGTSSQSDPPPKH